MPKIETKVLPKKKAMGGRTTKHEDDDTELTGKGWNAVVNKKAANEELAKAPKKSDFYLKDGESAQIQFLDDEPYCFNAHSVNVDGHYKSIPCQLATQKYCTLCDDKNKLGWKAGFRILDFRGTWDKDKKKFKHDKAVEKLWEVTQTVANQIRKQFDKKGTLLKSVFEISRSGSGKSDTAYNLETAFDGDEKMKPVKHTITLPELNELCAPPSDRMLATMGYGSRKRSTRDDDDDDVKV